MKYTYFKAIKYILCTTINDYNQGHVKAANICYKANMKT